MCVGLAGCMENMSAVLSTVISVYEFDFSLCFVLDRKYKQTAFNTPRSHLCYQKCCEHSIVHRCFLKACVSVVMMERDWALSGSTCQLSPAVNGNIYIYIYRFILEYNLNMFFALFINICIDRELIFKKK